MNEYPKIGDIIILRKDKINKTEIKYTVLQVKDWSDSGPLTAENHDSLVLEEYKPHITSGSIGGGGRK